jgi:hypothetical protein
MRHMRHASLAAAVAVVLSGAGLGAMTRGGGLPQFPATPARAHVALGEVRVLARPIHEEEPATPIAEAARARYGRVDALVSVRAEPLPGTEGGLVAGVAIRWR